MRYSAFCLFILIFLLAACQPGATPGDATGNDASSSQRVIQWDRDPFNVVFRIGTVGGADADALWRLNEVPSCTIYGDGRLIQVQELSDSTFTRIVFTRLTDLQIEQFIGSLTVGYLIYNYDAGFENQVAEMNSPVYEQIVVNVNGATHVTDAFANWPGLYYEEILEECQNLGDGRTIFEPEGAWVSVQDVEYNQGVPTLFWEPEASGLSLNDISSSLEKVWIEGANVKVLWTELRENGLDLQFHEDGVYYNLALEVPGVTVDAPPAPQAGTESS